MSNIDLPKRPDGSYLDIYAEIHQDDESKLQEYEEKIKAKYKIDEFEIQTVNHGTLKFHRDYTMFFIEDIKEGILTYLIFDEGVEYLGDVLIGIIEIDESATPKKFEIQIFLQKNYISEDGASKERKGLATEIWKAAPRIMGIIGINNYKGYTICTPIKQATERLLEKYGNPFEEETSTKYSTGSEI